MIVNNDAISFPATEAVIYLKNGQRKYGMLLDTITNGVFHFISNTNFRLFQETQNPDYIEIVSENLIEAIDVDLK